MSRKIMLLAGVALIAAMVTSGTALAAKGGGGKGHHPSPPATATCTVTPNTVPQWANDTISGSGFPANAVGGYSITGSGGTAMGFVGTDATGRFSTGSQGVWLGTNTVYVSIGGVSTTCTFVVY